MRKNVYLLAAAIISLVFAVAHTWWGATHAFPGIVALPNPGRANFETSWNQVGGTFLVGGIALLRDAFDSRSSLTVPVLVGSIYAMSFTVFVLLVSTRYPAVFERTAPQVTLFAVMLVLIAAGVRQRRLTRGA